MSSSAAVASDHESPTPSSSSSPTATAIKKKTVAFQTNNDANQSTSPTTVTNKSEKHHQLSSPLTLLSSLLPSSLIQPNKKFPTSVEITPENNDTKLQLYKGWIDASTYNISHLFSLFRHSPKFQTIFQNCFLLNGLIFVGSIIVLDYIFSPLFFHLLHFVSYTTATTTSTSTSTTASIGHEKNDGSSRLLQILYLTIKNLFWMWPIYTISLLFCSSWYNQVASLAFRYSQRLLMKKQELEEKRRRKKQLLRKLGKTSKSESSTTTTKSVGVENKVKKVKSDTNGSSSGVDLTQTRTKLVGKISDEIYRSILLLVFLVQISVVGELPYFLGPIASFCMTSWLYAFYAFDYVWTHRSYNTQQRLTYFEKHWAYMLGFGAPNALATYFFPFFINAGLWAMLFPVFIVLAMLAVPPPVPTGSKPLPIFYFVKRVLNWVLIWMGGWLSSKMNQSNNHHHQKQHTEKESLLKVSDDKDGNDNGDGTNNDDDDEEEGEVTEEADGGDDNDGADSDDKDGEEVSLKEE